MSTQRYIRDIPPMERKRLILSGQTTAGPLTILMVKHPLAFWATTVAIASALLVYAVHGIILNG